MVVYGLILALGVLQVSLPLQAEDFFRGDTTYFETARSLAETGFYGFNSTPQTVLPPGLPGMMALLCLIGACRYAIFLYGMAVFATLGLIASYEVLRREQGRTVASVLCLLVGSSPIFFAFATRIVFSDMPYLFTSMLALVVAMSLDSAVAGRARVALGVACAFLLVSSLLIRSAGITLVVGLTGWLAASWWTCPQVARRRARTFVPLVVIGLVVQLAWMSWVASREVVEWPIGGYPRSYVAQLGVKSGNYPELGDASLLDIPSRVAEHLADHAAALVALLTRKDYIDPAWSSPLVIGPVLLILLGVIRSMRVPSGGLAAWYFVGHEAMYLVWPWNFEMRFFLPVAPLAALYLWRGTEVLVHMIARKPRFVAACGAVAATGLSVWAGMAGWRSGGMQMKLATIFWLGLAVPCIGIAAIDAGRRAALVKRLLSQPGPPPRRATSVRAVGVVTVATLIGIGVVQQIGLGRENLAFDLTKQSWYPDIQAARWINAHTGTSAVAMARQADVVYHYARRRVVWFPPLSDPRQLMEGIRRHGVQFVVINHRDATYWWPPEEMCFEQLAHAYPDAFRLIHEGPRFKIFEALTGRAEGYSAGETH